MDRYFIVFYDARNNLNSSRGSCRVHNTDGTYVNSWTTIRGISLANPQFSEKDIVITNIIELNETDYKQFIG